MSNDIRYRALAALDELDDFISRVNGDDRGSCDSIVTIRAALAAPAPQPPCLVECEDGSRFIKIDLGHGKVEMGDSMQDGLPALWFGRDGQGMGFERERNETAKPGETIASVTFANVDGLDVLLEVLLRVRRRSFPDAPALPYFSVQQRKPLGDAEMRDAVDALGSDLWTVVGSYFRQGVRFAERAHGITAAPEGKQP